MEFQIGILSVSNASLVDKVQLLKLHVQQLSASGGASTICTPTKSAPLTPKRSTPFTSHLINHSSHMTIRKHATGAGRSSCITSPSPEPSGSLMLAKGKGREQDNEHKQDTLLSAFLDVHGLSHFHFAILLIADNTAPKEQVAQIEKLGIAQDIASKIVGAISVDQEHI